MDKRLHSRVLKEKLDDYWRGPYQICKIPENFTFHYLKELDDIPLAKTITRDQLKKFFSWTVLDQEQDRLYKIIQVRGDDDVDEQIDNDETPDDEYDKDVHEDE